MTLPTGVMPDFSGLKDFLRIEIVDPQGRTVSTLSPTLCLNGLNSLSSERVTPEAAATSPYPGGCPHHPYTLGSVQGIQAGWATSLLERGMRLKPR